MKNLVVGVVGDNSLHLNWLKGRPEFEEDAEQLYQFAVRYSCDGKKGRIQRLTVGFMPTRTYRWASDLRKNGKAVSGTNVVVGPNGGRRPSECPRDTPPEPRFIDSRGEEAFPGSCTRSQESNLLEHKLLDLQLYDYLFRQ